MNLVVIGIGSNINARENISRAVKIIRNAYEVLAESQLQWTSPVGKHDQPDFLNGAILLKTMQNREDLKSDLKSIEIQLGRKPAACKHGPRTIDLDIVVWNHEITDEDVYRRPFLRDAVLEVLPTLTLH